MAGLFPPIDENVVIGIADALGDTERGLTGSEIGRILLRMGTPDPGSGLTKRHRLAEALISQQRRDQAGNVVIRFVSEAVALGLHISDRTRFEQLRRSVNPALSLAGYRVLDTGKVGRVRPATTFDEVAALTNRLLDESRRRGVHHEVLRYCTEELLRESNFHAVSEATKGVCDRLRRLTGRQEDGTELVNACFSTKAGRPLVTINDWQTKSEASEHTGVADLIRGVIGTFRNPTAHAPRSAWPIQERDILDLFSTLSYIHRRLDRATVTPR